MERFTQSFIGYTSYFFFSSHVFCTTKNNLFSVPFNKSLVPEIGSLATDQCQHVTMQCIQRQHEIPGAMWRLILLFSLWKTHVGLSIFCQHWQAGPYLARPLLAHAVQG